AVDIDADAPRLAVAAKAAAANFERAQAFLQALLEGAANGHCLANALHLRRQRGICLREFLESEPRNLGYTIVNCRLKTRRCFARNVVLDFVEQVSDGQLGGDLG